MTTFVNSIFQAACVPFQPSVLTVLGAYLGETSQASSLKTCRRPSTCRSLPPRPVPLPGSTRCRRSWRCRPSGRRALDDARRPVSARQRRRADGGSHNAEPAQPALHAIPDIGSPPKTRAKAQNGTPNLRRNSGPSTSAVCCHVGHQKGRADAVSRVVFQEDAPDWDLLLSRHAVVLQFVSERSSPGTAQGLRKQSSRWPNALIMDDPQIVLFLDRRQMYVPSHTCRVLPISTSFRHTNHAILSFMSASSCPPNQ